MKKIKKIMAMLLAMVMVLGMTVTASAATGNNKISVTGADGATLKYVHVVEEDRTSPNGWKFVGGEEGEIARTFVSAWKTKDQKNNDADKVIKALIELGKIENPNNVKASNGTINSSAAFGAALDAIAKSERIAKADLNDDANTSAKGLYVVIAEKTGFTYMPMAAYINTAGDAVPITAKGSENQVKKEVTAQTHVSEEGDVLDYKVTANYPFFPANAQTKTFKITDTITNAEFVQGSVNVMVGNVNVTEKIAPVIDDLQEDPVAKKTTQTMKIDFTNQYNPEYAGKTVVVTYKAKVVDPFNVGDVVVSNNARCDVDDKYTTATVENKFATLTITKINDYKEIEDRKVLSDAEFTLYEVVENGAGKEISFKGQKYKLKKADSGKTVKTEGEKNGTVTFYGLNPKKTYFVEETIAPDGYVKLDTFWKLTGVKSTENIETIYHYTDGSTSKSPSEESKTLQFTEEKTTNGFTGAYQLQDDKDQVVVNNEVRNTSLSSLPSTGGIGTTIFTIGGCAIMVAAAGLFFASRRKANK